MTLVEKNKKYQFS